MLTIAEVVALTGISDHTLRKMVRAGTFPPPVTLVSHARWSVSTVKAWAEGRWRPAQNEVA
jgi:predicted DNA-binding transcriptional regulator AlpA